MLRRVGNLEIDCRRGDIAAQPDIACVVNAANAELMPGGDLALAPIKPGQAVITGGHNLPNRHVIHCLGPVYGRDEPAADLLASCYREALALADRHDIDSIAFPAISTGIFGYPAEPAAEVALKTVIAQAAGLSAVRRVRFVLFDGASLALHEAVLARLTGA